MARNNLPRTARQRREARRNSSRTSLLLPLFSVTFISVIAVVAIIVLALFNEANTVLATAPDLKQAKRLDTVPRVSVVRDRDGNRLAYLVDSDTLNVPVKAADIPETLLKATVAIEDRRFYQHNGVDLQGIARAALSDIEEGGKTQGASTITQQLIRNRFLNRQKSFKRKLIEAKLAIEWEKTHSKQAILVDYLNHAPYVTVGGQTAIGAGAAARVVFGKRLKDLTAKETALLAGLPQAPTTYNPFEHASAAKKRRNQVLDAMFADGALHSGRTRLLKAAALGVERTQYYAQARESAWVRYIRKQLVMKYGEKLVSAGGLDIVTSLDTKKQRLARKTIADTLNQKNDPSAALVTINPRNGDILAMSSSADSQFNVAWQGRRQPGSTFKAFVLAEALRQGVDPVGTHFSSSPQTLKLANGQTWKVGNYGGSYRGESNLVDATLRSDNAIYSQLALRVGPKRIAMLARRLGISSKLDGYAAESLGGLRKGVSPLEMAHAYASFANQGQQMRLRPILRVRFANGRTAHFHVRKVDKPLSTIKAGVLTDILTKNIIRGTGVAANPGCPAAGKTGTTEGFSDAWFIGYTPRLATSVWLGNLRSRKAMINVHGISVNGGSFPAQIWGAYTKAARGSFCGKFPKHGTFKGHILKGSLKKQKKQALPKLPQQPYYPPVTPQQPYYVAPQQPPYVTPPTPTPTPQPPPTPTPTPEPPPAPTPQPPAPTPTPRN